MHEAARNNYNRLAELFITNGADVNAKNIVSTALLPIPDRIPLSLYYDDLPPMILLHILLLLKMMHLIYD